MAVGEASEASEASGPGGEPVVVRAVARRLADAGLVLALVTAVVLFATLRGREPVAAVRSLLLGVAIVGVALSARRQRVEIADGRVRVVRTFRVEDVSRARIASVRAGRRGVPPHLHLVAVAAPVAVDGRPGDAAGDVSVDLPLLVGLKGLAAVLDVPALTSSGRRDLAELDADLDFRQPATRAGALTWLLTVGLVFGLTLLAVAGWAVAFG